MAGGKVGRKKRKGRKNGRKTDKQTNRQTDRQGKKAVRCGQDRILRGRESDTAEREMQFVAASVAVESPPRADR